MARKSGNASGYYNEGFKGPKVYCDVCGLEFYEESETRIQQGVRKCTVGPTHCFDVLDRDEDG